MVSTIKQQSNHASHRPGIALDCAKAVFKLIQLFKECLHA
jgi:hypothetical protein